MSKWCIFIQVLKVEYMCCMFLDKIVVLAWGRVQFNTLWLFTCLFVFPGVLSLL